MKRHKINNTLVQLRDDICLNKDLIDSVVHTNIHPSENTNMGEYKWVVYCAKSAKYSWIMLTEKEFNKYLKNYIK